MREKNIRKEHAQQFQSYGDKGSKKSVANSFAISLKCSTEGYYSFTLFLKENIIRCFPHASHSLPSSPSSPGLPRSTD